MSDSTISSWFWTETAKKKSWKFLENFSFYQNFQFSGSTTLYISCHNLAELWPRTKIFSPKYPSMIPLKVSCRHAYGNPSHLGDIGKDIRGVKLTPLGVYVDQKTLVFPGLMQNFTDVQAKHMYIIVLRINEVRVLRDNLPHLPLWIHHCWEEINSQVNREPVEVNQDWCDWTVRRFLSINLSKDIVNQLKDSLLTCLQGTTRWWDNQQLQLSTVR